MTSRAVVMGNPPGLRHKVVMAARLILPASGSLAMSGAQFVFVFVLLQRLPVADFGALAFLLVVHQFLIGCWSALFAAPLLSHVAMAPGDRLSPAAMIGAALIAMPVAFAIEMAIARINGFDAPAAIGFAAFSAMMLTRHFGRSWFLAQGQRARVIASDYAFAVMLGGLSAVCFVRPLVSLRYAALGQALAAVPALALLVPGVATWGALGAILRQVGAYRAVWRRDARWSLTGVLASEMTANVHAYIVTGLFGAAAYAPIAATALFIRPVLVVINPLVDFERMRMAVALGRGDRAAVRNQHAVLAITILGTWALTAVVALAIVGFAGTAALHDRVPLPLMWLSVELWLAVAFMRGMHAAESAVLQASGQFRMLAHLAMATAVISTVAVILAARLGGAIWSTAGVALGEGVYVWLVTRRRRQFFSAMNAGERPA